MISANNITLRVGKKALFEDVNIKFTEGNCYGVIGANGAGKSTFLRILSGQLEPTSGDVYITPGERLSFLEQDHFKYDDYTVMDTVIMGNQRLYDIREEKDALYAKADFTDEDGIRASELEAEFADMNGWEAEADAETLLNGLGIETEYHYATVGSLSGSQKVKILLARALFGNPDILLLDEPTNHLDLDAIAWLEEFLINFENTVIVVSHDRYFLNKVCTQIADIDYSKIQLYAGNYDFWFESSSLMIKQMKEANKKKEEKIKELQEFISRFAANASKSKQAPEKLGDLKKQRKRWHLGLFQSMVKHRKMLFNPRFGAVSFISYLYFLIYELLSPFIEIFGVFTMILAFAIDLINVPFMVLFFLIYAIFGSVLSLTAFFSRIYTSDLKVTFFDGVKACLLCVFEITCLRFILAWVRATAFIGYRKKKMQWGRIERKKINFK